MGKVRISEADLTFTPLQKSIFDQFSKNSKLVRTFYFRGGTALSAIYLHHRESEDLDFFAEKGFNNQFVEGFIDEIAEKNTLEVRFTEIFSTRIFNLVGRSGEPAIKIDFSYYPYERIGKGMMAKGVEIDSEEDIAVNKLMAINDRFEVKDYVDLYFLLQKFNIMNLVKKVKKKFKREVDLIMLASNFLKVEEFEVMPKMIIRIELSTIKEFFIIKAQELGEKIVEKGK